MLHLHPTHLPFLQFSMEHDRVWGLSDLDLGNFALAHEGGAVRDATGGLLHDPPRGHCLDETDCFCSLKHLVALLCTLFFPTTPMNTEEKNAVLLKRRHWRSGRGSCGDM